MPICKLRKQEVPDLSSLRGIPLTQGEKRWEEQFYARLASLGEQEAFQTSFLDPLQYELAKRALGRLPHLSHLAFGGYPNAERVRLAVFPAGWQGELPEVAFLRIEGKFLPGEPGHREVLGSILALGLRREQVGDIILLPQGGAAVAVMPAQADFICAQLLRVGSHPVSCLPAKPEELAFLVGEGKEINGTVASLRLDALLSLGFGISRSKAVPLIKSGLVRVNWREVTSPGSQLKAGDLISLRGRGRLEVSAVEGETRKGRVRVRLKKFI